MKCLAQAVAGKSRGQDARPRTDGCDPPPHWRWRGIIQSSTLAADRGPQSY